MKALNLKNYEQLPEIKKRKEEEKKKEEFKKRQEMVKKLDQVIYCLCIQLINHMKFIRK